MQRGLPAIAEHLVNLTENDIIECRFSDCWYTCEDRTEHHTAADLCG